MSYLKKIPFDNLKIDREFIMELDTEIRDEHIVNVIINIGHTLDKKIIAEGIETVAQRYSLIKQGCESANLIHTICLCPTSNFYN